MKSNLTTLLGAISFIGTLRVAAQPFITTQPISLSVEAGATATFRIVASATTPTTYQWRWNGVELPGATNLALTLANVQNTNVGKYTAVVTDPNGSVTSDPGRLTVHVPTLLFPMTNHWKFNHSGDDLGTNWKETTFDDSNWPEGDALFYNETRILLAPKNTLLALTNAAGQPILTYYFRTHFTFTGSKEGLMLVATDYVDDGAVFYLNGLEIGRNRVHNGPVAASTPAIIALEGRTDVMEFPADALAQGDNVLAVEVHQERIPHSDVVFGMSLKSTTLAPLLPDLIIPVPGKPHIELHTFAPGDCEVLEGCGTVGQRRLLRFDIEVRNAGTANLVLGDPAGNPHFTHGDCHDHYHYDNLVGLRLLDSNGGAVSISRKIGFALADVERWDTTNAPPDPSAASGTTLGITRGWSDIYSYIVPCQYVDITDTPPGSYILEFDVDTDNKVAELNESNNITRMVVEIPANWFPCSAPPSNDDFANAQIVPAGVNTVTGSTECATLEAGEPVIQDEYSQPARHSIWFRWTAPQSASATLDTQGSNFPTFMGLYRGTALSGLVPLASDAAFRGVGRASRIMASVTAGESYFIVVAGFYDTRSFVNRDTSGDVVLNINLNTNDLFPAAQVLTGTAGTVLGTTVGATKEPGEPNHAGSAGGRSIWYSWTAPVTGGFVFDTYGSTFNYPIFAANNTFDTVLAVYTGDDPSSLVRVASNDNANLARTSRVSFHAIAGTTYHLAVDGRGSATATGLCQLNWRPRLSLASTSLSSETIRFLLQCEPGDDCVLETSGDLKTWTMLQSVSNSPGAQVLQAKPGTTKFYRARLE